MESSGAEKIDVGEVPQGFYSLYYLAMKYLVVLAPKDGKDTYMVSFLVSAGCGGIDSSAIGKKSRPRQRERVHQFEIYVSKYWLILAPPDATGENLATARVEKVQAYDNSVKSIEHLTILIQLK